MPPPLSRTVLEIRADSQHIARAARTPRSLLRRLTLMYSTNVRISTLIIILAMFSLVASGFAQATLGPDGPWGRRGMGHGGGSVGA